jgi:undecaprenyl diphosphate synthase
MPENSNNNLNNYQKYKLIPNHIAIIMDGNRRWAKKNNLPRFAGHNAGIKTIRMVIAESLKAGVKILTLYAFSTENWKRSQREITSLMNLFQEVIEKEKRNLIKNQIKVKFIGDRISLSEKLKTAMNNLEKATEYNYKLILNIAINYGGRLELCNAFQSIYQQFKKNNLEPFNINEKIVNQNLFTTNIPDPDLLIRTGGEKRISNFLLWQIAYTELWFTNTFWPDFSKKDLWRALNDYEKRVRKFGGEI